MAMNSGPRVAMVWEGLNVGKTGGAMLGESHPADSKPGSLRGDSLAFKWAGTSLMAGGFCGEQHEIGLWFQPEELVDYKNFWLVICTP
uniref:nucleoside-diphosphate kinase n=1 Tax=Naja naja TaxID=35670 RepID=A0A8C6XKV2_NAJNA